MSTAGAVILIIIGVTFGANALNSLSGRHGTARKWKNMALAGAISALAIWGAVELLN